MNSSTVRNLIPTAALFGAVLLIASSLLAQELVPSNEVIYGLTPNNDLMWYGHTGRNDGSFRWAAAAGKKVGVGWSVRQVFPGDDGVIYAIMQNGDLMWYRHAGRGTGSFLWAAPQGKKVGRRPTSIPYSQAEAG